MPIQFVGWSSAAMRFRKRAAAAASSKCKTLIVGEDGVDLEAMAAAIQAEAKIELPFLNLRLDPCPDGPCVAISTVPPAAAREEHGPAGAQLFHLGEGKFAPVPVGECNGEPLPNALAARFRERLYMPPLRQRRLDILAALHQMNARHGGAHFISSRLIHRLVFDWPWLGNESELTEYLLGEVPKAAKRWLDDSYDEFPPMGPFQIQKQVPGQRLVRDYPKKRKGLDHQKSLWDCEERDVRPKHLPFVALSAVITWAMRWRENMIERRAIRLRAAADPSIGPLGNFAFTEDPFASQVPTQSELLPLLSEMKEPMGPVAAWIRSKSWPALNSISTATTADLLALATLGSVPTNGFPATLLRYLDKFEGLGASLDSIRNGVQVRRQARLKRYTPQKPSTPKARRGHPPSQDQPLTERKREIAKLFSEGMIRAEIARKLKKSPSYITQVMDEVEETFPNSDWKVLCDEHKKQRRSRPKAARKGRFLQDRGQDVVPDYRQNDKPEVG